MNHHLEGNLEDVSFIDPAEPSKGVVSSGGCAQDCPWAQTGTSLREPLTSSRCRGGGLLQIQSRQLENAPVCWESFERHCTCLESRGYMGAMPKV